MRGRVSWMLGDGNGCTWGLASGAGRPWGQRAPARQSHYRQLWLNRLKGCVSKSQKDRSCSLLQSWHHGGVKGPQTLVLGRAATRPTWGSSSWEKHRAGPVSVSSSLRQWSPHL